MGKFKDKFKKAAEVVGGKVDKVMTLEEGGIDSDDFTDYQDIDPKNDSNYADFEVNTQPAQKSESFHHMLLENKYQDMELSIRGYKKVYNKTTNKWETKRNDKHCFTDEEAEHILRTAQTHLSTDIKLSYISLNIYPQMMLAIKNQLQDYFYNIADYKYGRYGDSKEQFFMKQENHNIFVMLMSRITANYSMAIQGSENRNTHNAVKGQESLNNTDRDVSGDKGYY